MPCRCTGRPPARRGGVADRSRGRGGRSASRRALDQRRGPAMRPAALVTLLMGPVCSHLRKS